MGPAYILQAYDSLAINADVELGGTDQKFNILAGRDLLRAQGLEPQCALLMPLLPGLDGRKMSKSFGNDIPVACGADEQFARIMSLSDGCIEIYQRLVLLESNSSYEETSHRIASGENPMRMKLELATRIVERFNGLGTGETAKGEWERRFSKREPPSDVPAFSCDSEMGICRILCEGKLTHSMSEARRLVLEGAVSVDDRRVSDITYAIEPSSIPEKGLLLRIGRRRFLRLFPI